MISKLELVFSFTSAPTNLAAAAARSGGWTEGHWYNLVVTPGEEGITQLATFRARMLPIQAAIVGFRIALYTIAGNKLLPGGTSAGALQFPGNAVYTANLPQDSLQLSGFSESSPNTDHFNLRCLPDEVTINGEWAPTTGFRNALTNFTSQLINSGAGFVGRVKSNPLIAVNGYGAGVVQCAAAIPGAVVGSSLRFLRVYDDEGVPIKGSYVITAISGNNYTIANGPAQITNKPNGNVRLDQVAWFKYGTINPARTAVKKIGRPSIGYRGRRSAVSL